MVKRINEKITIISWIIILGGFISEFIINPSADPVGWLGIISMLTFGSWIFFFLFVCLKDQTYFKKNVVGI